MRSRTFAAVAIALGFAFAAGHAGDASARGKKKPPATKPVKTPAKPAKPAAAAAPTAEQKKAMLELMGAYKFGMSKDEIVAQLTKQIDERYADQIKGTSDVMTQDKLRKEKQKEVTRVKQSFIDFDGKKSGYDVSLIDKEFAHHTGESMLTYWENEGGKNQKRFFFFFNGKLWKMFVAFDTKQLASENRNFGYFSALLEQRYGKGVTEGDFERWNGGEFEVRAVDRMTFYGALGLSIHDTTQVAEIEKVRKEKAPEAKGKDNIIEVVKRKGDASDDVNLEENNDAVNAIINGSK